MLLERHFDPKRPVSIHVLRVEAPQKADGLPFDPERDLTEEDWEKMERDIRLGFLDVLKRANAALIYPDKKSELRNDPLLWQVARERFHNARAERDYNEMLLYGRAIKILFPEHLSELGLQRRHWNEVKDFVKVGFQRSSSALADDAAMLRFLFPEYSFEEYKEKTLGQLPSELEKWRKAGNWSMVCAMNAQMKIIFPSVKPPLDIISVQGMRKRLNELRQSDVMSAFNLMAVQMKILAAEEVKITDSGVEIIMPESNIGFETPIAPLPETRNF